MVFNSYLYVFVFLPAVFTGYILLRESRYQNYFLTAASFLFYAYSVVWYIFPLIISSIIDFFIGRRMSEASDEVLRRRLLLLSVCTNIGLLSFFKYTGWITTEFAQILSLIGITAFVFIPPLPPGISFYTFQTMSYTIDIYRGEFRPKSSFIDYLAFVSFFPQLVAGPIERARHLLPQISDVRPLASFETISQALYTILFGLMLKTVVADNAGGIVEQVERALVAGASGTEGLGLVYAYGFAFQIYADFAAYSLIAIGSAKLFGIHLNKNFLTPYFAASPSEFWRRWHISLSSWLRDYLYIALGGNKNGSFVTLRNLLITMTLGGLWHGAGVLFIVWGVYHGLLLIIYRVLPIDRILERVLGHFGKFLAVVLFFHLVCIGWIFFRATPETFWLVWGSIAAIPDAFERLFGAYWPYWQQVYLGDLPADAVFLATLKGFVQQNWLFSVYLYGILIFAVPALVADTFGYRNGCEFPDLFDRMSLTVRVATILIFVYLIAFFGRRAGNEFIYFQF